MCKAKKSSSSSLEDICYLLICLSSFISPAARRPAAPAPPALGNPCVILASHRSFIVAKALVAAAAAAAALLLETRAEPFGEPVVEDAVAFQRGLAQLLRDLPQLGPLVVRAHHLRLPLGPLQVGFPRTGVTPAHVPLGHTLEVVGRFHPGQGGPDVVVLVHQAVEEDQLLLGELLQGLLPDGGGAGVDDDHGVPGLHQLLLALGLLLLGAAAEVDVPRLARLGDGVLLEVVRAEHEDGARERIGQPLGPVELRELQQVALGQRAGLVLGQAKVPGDLDPEPLVGGRAELHFVQVGHRVEVHLHAPVLPSAALTLAATARSRSPDFWNQES
eukprot:CAMPEP_0194712488 /NCGR_PEP_ID=MMETSP0296-20130528/4543_1 /TAXON_ID=39354 /ORGANISM="Heterosigma akashiwo, Strain CCMP2393" /LENGTH=330 /DNA_ID=CAMNT_0039610879 /DNA_START=64 /DNA_END=1057 /DNA_ORIENTATION=-